METEESLSHDSTESAFKALYAVILGRQASDAEIAHWVSQHPKLDIIGLVNLIYAFSNSPEVQGKRNLAGKFGDIIGKSREAEGVEAVKAVISLGDHCFTSTALKLAELRTYSGPFDWIFSSPDMVIHCLKDDFKTFLDRRFHEAIPVDKRWDGPDVNLANHIFYKDNYGVNSVFNHHDPITEEGYAYFQRCVEWFRKVSTSGQRNLFLMVSPHSNKTAEQFHELSRCLKLISDKNELLFLATADRPVDRFDVSEISILETLQSDYLLLISTASKVGGVAYDDPFWNLVLERILKTYSIDIEK